MSALEMRTPGGNQANAEQVTQNAAIVTPELERELLRAAGLDRLGDPRTVVALVRCLENAEDYIAELEEQIEEEEEQRKWDLLDLLPDDTKVDEWSSWEAIVAAVADIVSRSGVAP